MQTFNKIAIVSIAFAVVAVLSFIGGTKFPGSRLKSEPVAPAITGDLSLNGSTTLHKNTLNSEPVAPATPSNDISKDSDIITELKDGGVRILWIRSAGGRLLNQYKFDSDGTLALRVIYTIDESGAPRTCKIFNVEKTEIFKVSYGYRRTDGVLVEERIFDSRHKRLDDQGKELPVLRILHVVDAISGESKRELIKLVSHDFPQELEGGFSNPFQKP